MSAVSDQIDSSHKMGEWQSTIVTLTGTPRFGSIRKCEYCGGEHAQTVAGEAIDYELERHCEYAPLSDQPPAAAQGTGIGPREWVVQEAARLAGEAYDRRQEQNNRQPTTMQLTEWQIANATMISLDL